MRFARAAVLVVVASVAVPVHAQSSPFSLSGFWEALAIGIVGAPTSVPLTTQFNGRLDLRWFPSDGWDGYAAGRLLTTYGGIVESVPGYSDLVTQDPGWMDLTFAISSADDHVAYVNLDRFSIQHTRQNLEIQVGRQRVNWGVNFAWNPNDIFNASSYFDITYIEQPGSDALRTRYYTGPVSAAEVAVKVDFDDRVTAAGMYRTNVGGYDLQAFVGSVQGATALGFGWSGQLGSAGFNGELTYFGDGGEGLISEAQFLAAAGANYTFASSLMLTTEFIYNSLGSTDLAGRNPILGARFVDVRSLSPARWNVMASASYVLSSLTNVALSSVFNPDDQSVYVSPQVAYSLSNNITATAAGQLLLGESGTQFDGDGGSSVFVWIKGAF